MYSIYFGKKDQDGIYLLSHLACILSCMRIYIFFKFCHLSYFKEKRYINIYYYYGNSGKMKCRHVFQLLLEVIVQTLSAQLLIHPKRKSIILSLFPETFISITDAFCVFVPHLTSKSYLVTITFIFSDHHFHCQTLGMLSCSFIELYQH